MTDRELLQQALDTLRHLCLHSRAVQGYDGEQVQTAIDALKARLAQPENKFNPDWDAMAVMVEEQQRMAKRIEGLEAQLAQPEPEPITMVVSETGDPSVTMSWWHEPALPVGTPLYTAPPQREWVGLTDAEVEKVFFDMGQFAKIDLKTFARAIEAKLKEKNT